EDLLQAALERLLRNWRRIETDAEGYLWRTLYHLAADGWRRRGRGRGRVPSFPAPGRARAGGGGAAGGGVGGGRGGRPCRPPAAGGDRAALLGAAHRGRDRGAARLLGGIGQVRRSTGAVAAARTGGDGPGARKRARAGHPRRGRNRTQANGGTIMNGDVEELLREGLDRLTAQVEVPPGMVGRARAHHRRRKIAAGAALACGTAAVTAVAVIAVASPGTRPGTGGVTTAQTTAYVISRVENALAAEHFVIQERATGSMTYSVHGHRGRSSNGLTIGWAYGERHRMEEFTGRD